MEDLGQIYKQKRGGRLVRIIQRDMLTDQVLIETVDGRLAGMTYWTSIAEFYAELEDVISAVATACDCGGAKINSTHSNWCSTRS